MSFLIDLDFDDDHDEGAGNGFDLFDDDDLYSDDDPVDDDDDNDDDDDDDDDDDLGQGDELPNFDPDSGDDVIGDPADAMEDWHLQDRPDSCAVVSQEFVLESLTGEEFSEDELVAVAEENGWYTPGGGTAPADMGKVIEAYGIETEQWESASMSDLHAVLEAGGTPIVGVDANEIWTPGFDGDDDSVIGDFPGYPGQDANHAVTVIGINESNGTVILNDSGHPEGRGEEVPFAEFEDAWADSNHLMVTAGPAANAAVANATSLFGASSGTALPRFGSSADDSNGWDVGINEDTGNTVSSWPSGYWDNGTWEQVEPA